MLDIWRGGYKTRWEDRQGWVAKLGSTTPISSEEHDTPIFKVRTIYANVFYGFGHKSVYSVLCHMPKSLPSPRSLLIYIALLFFISETLQQHFRALCSTLKLKTLEKEKRKSSGLQNHALFVVNFFKFFPSALLLRPIHNTIYIFESSRLGFSDIGICIIHYFVSLLKKKKKLILVCGTFT